MGFSLLEVMAALLVAGAAAIGILTSIISGQRLQRQTEEYGRASRAIRHVHETLRAGDLDARVAERKQAPTFDLGSISVTVRFPEHLLVALYGAPVPVGWRYRDLDSDGEVDLDPAATASASLVPVVVTASWSTGSTNSAFFVTEK